ncbi:MAG: hypothetical protein HRT72_02950 [Flavobacteriales bacterium]|nr:hypothetical protein [Flavobacteriales bacterium]
MDGELKLLFLMLIVAMAASCSQPRPEHGVSDAFETSSYEMNDVTVQHITWHNESAIAVIIDKHVMFKVNYFSETGHNGYFIKEVIWSPDSSCFAFKLFNAGGHMPYRSPVKIARIKSKQLN